MRTDHVTRHMKLHLKFTPKGDDICKDIVLDLVDRVLEENRSDVKRKYDEDDMQKKIL